MCIFVCIFFYINNTAKGNTSLMLNKLLHLLHVMYADDISLLAPSAIGLQRMLDVCLDFSIRIMSSLILLNLYVLFLNLKVVSCIV